MACAFDTLHALTYTRIILKSTHDMLIGCDKVCC